MLTELAERALAVVQELQARGCEVDFQHVRRAFNPEADRLANAAMDAEADSLNRTPDFALARTVTQALIPLEEKALACPDRLSRGADSSTDSNGALACPDI